MALRLVDGDAWFELESTAVRAGTAWVRSEIPLTLASPELTALADALRNLAEAGHGSALWTNEGGEIRLEVVMAKRGETHFSVRLQSAPDFLHELRLVFVGRQSDLVSQADDVILGL